MEALLHHCDHFDPAVMTTCNKSRKTPLHAAAGNGGVEVVKIMLSAFAETLKKGGVDILAATDIDGQTPLHLACKVDNGEVVTALIAAGEAFSTDPMVLSAPRVLLGEELIECDSGCRGLACLTGRCRLCPHFFTLAGASCTVLDNSGSSPMDVASSCSSSGGAAALRALMSAENVKQISDQIGGHKPARAPLGENMVGITMQKLCLLPSMFIALYGAGWSFSDLQRV